MSLTRSAGRPRHAGIVDGLFTRLADHEVHLGAGLVHDLLDAAGMDPAVGDQLRDGEARDLPAHRIEARQDDRLGGVVDDQVDAGGLLEGTDVAALAPDDPALHLVAGEMDDGHGVLGGVVRRDPLHRRHDDLAGPVAGLLAGPPLDGSGQLDGVVLGLVADRLEQDPLGVLRGQARHDLQGGDPLLVEAAELLALVLDVALAVVDLAALLLEHVGALVELLVTGQQPPLEVLELRALGASLLLGLTLLSQLLVLGLEDQVLLLRPGLGHDARRLVLGGLERLVGQRPAGEEPHGDACDARGQDGHDGDDRLHLQFLPPGGMNAPGVLTRFGLGLRTTGNRLGFGNGAGPGRAPPAPHRCRGSPGARPTVRVRLSP